MKIKNLKSLIKEVIKEMEDFEAPTTGWAAPESAKEKLLDLIPLANLTERESMVIQGRLEGYSLEELGKKYNVNRSRIAQILNNATRKLIKISKRYNR